VAHLRAQGRPRLLLVAADADAPQTSDWDEDWIRLPARDDDVHARAAALETRGPQPSPRPEVKGDGRLAFDGRWVALSHTEEAMVRVLARRFGEVVDANSLASAAGERRLSPNAVRVHLTRLRRRVQSIGLVVRTVRGRGYVLDPEGPRAVARLAWSTLEGGAEVIAVGELIIDGPRHRVTLRNRPVELTPTEFAFLSVLARRAGQVVTHQMILEDVWGPGVENTEYLRVYAAQIRKKLGDHPPRLITEPRVGYRLVDPLVSSA